MKPSPAASRAARRFLEDGEAVTYAATAHPVVLLRPVAGFSVLMAAAAGGFVAWSSAPAWFGLLLAGSLVVGAAWLAAKVLAQRCDQLVVTSQRIVHRRGVLRREGREIPVSRVEDAVYLQSLLGRLLGYGSLAVEPTGAAPAEAFRRVRSPETLAHAIHRAAEAARAVVPPGVAIASEEAEPVAPPSVPDHLALLEALYHRGIVSEAELHEKREELLGGR